MAEMDINRSSLRKGSRKINKKNTRVDLTPMVDLGFLLITFFVFTTSLMEPTVMQVNMPYDKTHPDDPVCESCVMTVILESDNSIRYYEGSIGNKPEMKETGFNADGIRKVIMKKKKDVERVRGSGDQFVLIIMPKQGSTFKNFVDILDEVLINNVKRYYIDDEGH